MKKIVVDVTTEDCQELMEGKVFKWFFKGVEVNLYNPDEHTEICPFCKFEFTDGRRIDECEHECIDTEEEN